MSKQLHSVNPMINDDIEENRPKRDSTARNERLTTLFRVAGLLLAGFIFGFALKTITTSEDVQTEAASPPVNDPQPVPIPPANPPDDAGELDIPRLEDLPRTTFVHLFSWKWTDIEKECVNVLGPRGFSAVQVSPVNEHIEPTLIRNIIGKPDNPWWARYQPVSYKIESRSGTREEFISMIETCRSVGVGIYVDAVLNHMAAMNVGVGNAGTPFDSDNLIYPDPTVNFDASHFNECDPPEIQGEDYGSNAERVRRCRLVGLPDLLQESPFVRDKMVAFLQDLSDMGVEGLRLDVAKHMFPLDLDAILSRVTGLDYVFGEVPSYGGEVVLFEDYTPYFDVTEFRYKADLQNIFMAENRRLAELENIGQSFGYVATTEAVVFVDNHDTQRATDARLIFRAGQVYNLANIFLLSWPYGYPKLMSSYYFEEGNFDVGPPEYTNEGAETVDVYTDTGDLCSDPSKTSFDSSDTWICEHRRREMLNMVHFKNYAHYKNAFDITNWWTNGFQAIGYSRSGPDGVMGYVIINKEDFAFERSYYTGLRDGVYCDVINGDFTRNVGCSGRTVVVQDGGYINVNMEAMSGLAIFEGARLS